MHAASDDTLLVRLGRALGDAYRLEAELPAGGMGRVFVAWQPALQRKVVVKVADGAHAVDVRRFQQEILLSASLQHPHIVPVHSAGDVEGVPYFIMPFVDGASLRARLDDASPVRPAEVMRTLRDVASALHYAHRRGVVHRDLKPANVMLQAGSVMVLDFGVAKAMAGSAPSPDAITGVGYAVGTPGYMAPEQIAGDPSLDHRADLYAFGVLAFELCAGRPVFTGSRSEVMRQHLALDPPDLATLRPDLPAELIAVVRACLQKRPADRPADAGVVLDLLDGVHPPALVAQAGASRMRAARSVAAVRQLLSPTVLVPMCYAVVAVVLVGWLLYLAEQGRIREGLVVATVVGSLLGFPVAIASGVLIRLVERERMGA